MRMRPLLLVGKEKGRKKRERRGKMQTGRQERRQTKGEKDVEIALFVNREGERGENKEKGGEKRADRQERKGGKEGNGRCCLP